MDRQGQYIAGFVVNDEVIMEIADDDKDKLIARAIGLLESAFQSATCSIKNTQTDTVVQTLKRSPAE